MTSTDQLAASPLTGARSTEVDPGHPTPSDYRPVVDAPAECEMPSEGRSSLPGKAPHNPVRISRIGSDHLQVLIRPVHGCGELMALVDRLEQLIGAGYDAIDVVFEPTHHASSAVRHEYAADRSAASRCPRD